MMQEFTQEMKNLMIDALHDVHTVIPGRVVSFDSEKCEADVLPFGKFKTPNGKVMDYPKCPGVPVCIPQGAGQMSSIVYPIRPGDECLLLFSEQALDMWRSGAASDTDLRFDLTNAVALIGLFAKPNPNVKEACDTGAIIIESGGKRITISQEHIGIKGDILVTGSVHVTGNLTSGNGKS